MEMDMKRSKFTKEQIIGVLKDHKTGLSAASSTVCSPPSPAFRPDPLA
jgi:hypothetical protein